MAQQRVFMGSVVAAIPTGGDETHPIYVREGKAYQIDQVADSAHADNADHADNSDEATHAGVSDKVGTETIGSPWRPVYIKDGVPTVVEDTFGNSAKDTIVLGDGSVVSVNDFLDQYVDMIREKLGIVTTEKNGLVPKLPTQ